MEHDGEEAVAAEKETRQRLVRVEDEGDGGHDDAGAEDDAGQAIDL